MARKETLPFVVIASLVSVGTLVGCGAAPEGAPDQSTAFVTTATDDSNDAPTNAQPSALPSREDEGDRPATSREGDDPGFTAFLASVEGNKDEALGQPAPAEPADEPDLGEDVESTSSALTTARRIPIGNEATRIANFTNRSTSWYQSETYMNESNGTRRADCSGLAGYIVKRASERAWELLLTGTGKGRPASEDFHDYIKSRSNARNTGTLGKWRRLNYAKSLKPGDMLVWKYPASWGKSTTGHTMIVKGNAVPGRANEILVDVTDSVMSKHANDTRGVGDTGPGAGRIGLRVDDTGKPIGYYWSGGISTTVNYASIAMGRYE
jgi:hypothetical protein